MTMREFVLYSVICMLAHELGHIVAARCMGVPVKRLGLGWRGMYIVRERSAGWREAAVCMAGPVANLLLAAAMHDRTWLATANLYFFAINLLPLPHSDFRHAWQALRGSVERRLA